MWDTGPARTVGTDTRAPSTAARTRRTDGDDPHETRAPPRAARTQKSEFLKVDGHVVDVCGGKPCHSTPVARLRCGTDAAAARARVRRGNGLAGRRDRGGAAARPVLRRLHDRLGEHDRRRCSWRCRSATGSAGAWRTATRTCAALCLLALTAAVLLALVPFAADPLLDVAVDALDEISAGAFVGSLFAVLALVAVPVLLLGTVSPWAIRLAVSIGRGGRARWPGASTRSRPPGSLVGHAGRRRCCPDPAGGHAPHVPDLRAGDRRRGRLGPAAAAAAGRSRRRRSPR